MELALFRAVAVALLILANGFFVAAEFALVSVRETRIEQMIARGRPGAHTVRRLQSNLDDFLPAVQFGVTLCSLALGWIGEPVVADALEAALRETRSHHVVLYSHLIAVPIAFAFITYFHVLLGELVPKSLALRRADQLALAVAGPMDFFIRLTRPAVRIMNRSASAVLVLFRAPMARQGAVHSPEELKMMATATRRMGLLPEFQEAIIHRAVELNNVVVREIMTPRQRIFALPADMLIEQASERVVEEQHSRIPVYDSMRGPEHIIGVVYSKDLSRLTHFRVQSRTAFSDLRLQQIMREILVVPETKPVVEMLMEFRQRRRHIAIVVDEFGSTVGLVTVEDALEQVVGEIHDEFDYGERPLLSTAAGALVLDGGVGLRDLETQMHLHLPRDAGVETLAGFLLTRLGKIPQGGEQVDYEGRRFTVAEMAGHRISKVRVEPLADAVPQVDGATDERARSSRLPARAAAR